MPEISTTMLEPHDKAEELLPWYATGQLDAEDRQLVEQHVSSCAHCRRQLAFERRMIDEFAGLIPDVDSGWARLRKRIEPRESWWGRAAREAASAWYSLNRPAVAALAAAQLAFVVIAGGVLLSLTQPSYRALGSKPPPQSANVIAMFRADTTESELTKLLQANDASLVGGPTSTEAYLISVPQSSRPQVLAQLRADRHVTMAEPIDGPR